MLDSLRKIARTPTSLRARVRRLLLDAKAGERDAYYRAPQELRARRADPLKLLLVGSCTLDILDLSFRKIGHEVELITFNNVADLPRKTVDEIVSYDLQLVQIPLRSLVLDHIYMKLSWDDLEGHKAHFEHVCTRLDAMLDASLRYHEEYGLTTIVSNFLLPQQNATGRLLPRYDIRNPVHLIERLNRRLYERTEGVPGLFYLDTDEISATFGRMHHQDDHLWSLSHGGLLSDFDGQYDRQRIERIKPLLDHYPLRASEFALACCHEVEALYRTVRQIDQVKLVVIDLDDTLWRGVAAEQGHVGETEGWPLGVWEALAFLKARGVLLAIISKNDEGVVKAFWDRYVGARLPWDFFVARRINWEPKPENMRQVLDQVNLLPRNVVFVDDNPVERAAMTAAFPDIRVLGAEPYVVRRVLLWSAETQVATITAEAGERTQMLQAEAERAGERQRLSRDDFLATLGLEVRRVEIRRESHPLFARAFELLNKTNQFNTTGRRWTHADVAALFKAGGAFHAFEVKDRFSHYGLTGLIIAVDHRLEQFVMSCRVVGLDVELAMLASALLALKGDGAWVEAAAEETDANRLSRDIFERAGFQRVGGVWRLETGTARPAPSHVVVS